MIWNTQNRIYLHNATLCRATVLGYLEQNIRHIHHIVDIACINNGFIEQLKERYCNVYKYKNTKLHFTIIRPKHISKRVMRSFKDKLREALSEINMTESRYCIETALNYYVKLTYGRIYRITSIPNTNESDYVLCKDMYSTDTLIRVAGIEPESCVDGVGMRYVLFVQGCPHHCKECHNQSTWDFSKGRFMTIPMLAQDITSNPMLRGITFSGGEPLMQAEALLELKRELEYYYRAKNKKFDFTLFTGFKLNTIQNIHETSSTNIIYIKALLNEMNYVIDGRFEKDKKTLDCKFRGSYNQKMYRKTGDTIDNFEEIYPYTKNVN